MVTRAASKSFIRTQKCRNNPYVVLNDWTRPGSSEAKANGTIVNQPINSIERLSRANCLRFLGCSGQGWRAPSRLTSHRCASKSALRRDGEQSPPLLSMPLLPARLALLPRRNEGAEAVGLVAEVTLLDSC